jgi:WD40 repeat protein
MSGGQYLAVSNDKTVELRDAETFEIVKKIDGFLFTVLAMGFSHCGTRLAVTASNSKPGSANKVLIYDVETLSITSELVDNSEILAVAFNYSGSKIMTRSYGGLINMYDLNTSQLLWTLHTLSTGFIVQLFALFSVDDQRVITCHGGASVVVLDANTGNNLISFEGHSVGHSIQSIAVSPVGDVAASCSDDDTTIVWDLFTGEFLHVFRDLPEMAAALYYFPDGSKLVITMTSMICIYHTGTWELLYSLSSDDDMFNNVFSVSISPAGTRIAWSYWYSKEVVVYDLESQVSLFSMKSVRERALCSFSPNTVVLL